MCKEDPYQRLVMLKCSARRHATDKDSSEIESPGTPSGPVIEPQLASTSGSTAAASSDETVEKCAIFFARVSPLVPYEELFELFSKYGTVADLNLFKRWATAKTSKGCGTVKYNCPKAAAAALEALHGVYSFDAYVGCEGPMVVEWMDASRLTSADAAAAAKAAKAKAAAAAAAAQKPQHSSKHRAKLHSSSSGRLPNWSYMQKLSALAQHYNSDSRAALTGFAGAGASTGFAQGMQGGSFVGGVHPALDALDLSGLLGSGPFSPDTGNCSIAGSGLCDPFNWNTSVPVHLLPMMSKPHAASTMGPSNLAALNPMLPSPACNQLNLSGSLLPSPAAAAAAAAAVPSPNSMGTGGMDRSLSAASAFGCATPAIEPWLSGGLPSRTNSTNLSFTSQSASTFGAGTGSSGFFVAAAAAAEQQQQQIQQQAQQQMMPLMMLEDAWVNQSCDGFASAPTTLGNVTQSNAGQLSHTGPASGSYGLFDNNSLLLQLNEAVAAAGASAAANTINSSSILSVPCVGASAGPAAMGSSSGMVATDVTGFLSGRLSSVLNRSEGYMPMQGAGASGSQFVSSSPGLAAANSGGSSGQQPVAKTTLRVPLSEARFSAVVPHLISIMKMSGANVNTAGNVEEGTYELSIKGAPAEVEAAENLVYLLSADS